MSQHIIDLNNILKNYGDAEIIKDHLRVGFYEI